MVKRNNIFVHHKVNEINTIDLVFSNELPISVSYYYGVFGISLSKLLTHRGPVDLRKWAIFNTILMSPKSWLSQEDLDAGCEHSMVPVDS